jgi:hypothetical protein
MARILHRLAGRDSRPQPLPSGAPLRATTTPEGGFAPQHLTSPPAGGRHEQASGAGTRSAS